MKLSPIHIAFSANISYYQHTCVLMASVLANNPDEQFCFYVMTDKNDEAEENKIRSLSEYFSNFTIRFIVMDDVKFAGILSSLHPDCRTMPYYSPQALYRLCLSDILPELDKILYLDCDMVCTTPLRELLETPLDGYYVAGCYDNFINSENCYGRPGKEYLASINYPEDGKTYVNSGMLLMNLAEIRQNNKVPELLEWFQTATKRPAISDQDAINCVFYGGVKLIDAHWNWCSADVKLMSFPQYIAHFVGHSKPWNTKIRCRHPAAKDYWKYLKLTPYKNFIRRYRWEHFWQYQVFFPIEVLKRIFRF